MKHFAEMRGAFFMYFFRGDDYDLTKKPGVLLYGHPSFNPHMTII